MRNRASFDTWQKCAGRSLPSELNSFGAFPDQIFTGDGRWDVCQYLACLQRRADQVPCIPWLRSDRTAKSVNDSALAADANAIAIDDTFDNIQNGVLTLLLLLLPVLWRLDLPVKLLEWSAVAIATLSPRHHPPMKDFAFAQCRQTDKRNTTSSSMLHE